MKSPNYAGQRAGESSQNDERIEPDMEVDYEQQVNQRNRHQHSDGQSGEARAHGRGLTAQNNIGAGRRRFFRFRNDGLDVGKDTAQVSRAHAAEDIDYRHYVVVRINGLAGSP